MAGIRGRKGEQVLHISSVGMMNKAYDNKDVVILLAEDDEAHAELVRKNFARLGLDNPLKRFKDGQEITDFFFAPMGVAGDYFDKCSSYLLLLDIRMPRLDGMEVLRKIRSDGSLKHIPIIMITTTEDPYEIEKCYMMGCNNYISKPVDGEKFIDAMKPLGFFGRLRDGGEV